MKISHFFDLVPRSLFQISGLSIKFWEETRPHSALYFLRNFILTIFKETNNLSLRIDVFYFMHTGKGSSTF